jgi:hypothetical protein
MESAIIGTGDHALLRPYFGLGENSIPDSMYSEIETIIIDSTDIFTGYSLNYLYGSNADYGIDALEADLGIPLNYSQENAVRGVYYDSGLYRTIASSTFFGAMADGTIGNTKAEVMAQYLSFLIGDPSPNIVVSEDELDFWITFPENSYTLELEISNTGLDTLLITNIVISGEGFNYIGSTEFTIVPLEQQVLEIEFETYETGQYLGELTITSNDPDTPELVIQLSAECVLPPIIQCDPLLLDIALSDNQIHEEIITLSNMGGSDLNCELVIMDSSQYAGWLEIDQDFCLIQTNEYEEILLTFDPDGLETGQYYTEIVIYHNDPNQDELIIPITMNLNYTNAESDLILAANKLIGNYPNPFNPTTTISYQLLEESEVELTIYNIKGQKVNQLVNNQLSAGQHSVVWNGKDDADRSVSSGIYFYKMKTDNHEETKRMILMK